MPKRYRVVATVTEYDGNQQINQDTSTEEYDVKQDADQAYEKKKRGIRTGQ